MYVEDIGSFLNKYECIIIEVGMMNIFVIFEGVFEFVEVFFLSCNFLEIYLCEECINSFFFFCCEIVLLYRVSIIYMGIWVVLKLCLLYIKFY